MQSILGWDDPTVKNMLHESAVRVNHKGDTVTINRSKKRSLASQLHLAKALTLKANQFIESQLTPPALSSSFHMYIPSSPSKISAASVTQS